MKAFCIFFLIFFTMSGISAQNNIGFKKDHDAILVKDVNASAKFYGEILGLKEIPNGGLPDHIRWFQLEDNVQLHIIESEELPEKHKGFHMALSTSDLEKFMLFLKDKEIAFENWGGEASTTNTRPDGVKQVYLQDPDGYWIEINDNQL